MSTHCFTCHRQLTVEQSLHNNRVTLDGERVHLCGDCAVTFTRCPRCDQYGNKQRLSDRGLCKNCERQLKESTGLDAVWQDPRS